MQSIVHDESFVGGVASTSDPSDPINKNKMNAKNKWSPLLKVPWLVVVVRLPGNVNFFGGICQGRKKLVFKKRKRKTQEMSLTLKITGWVAVNCCSTVIAATSNICRLFGQHASVSVPALRW